MKKLLLLFLLVTASVLSYAQTYNNEWIDYSKTYYKFNVGATGLYRIPQSALSAAGLGGVSADQFQLWRNGVEVPLYTTISSGTLGNSDFIEFYGLQNDGTLDTKLYKYDSLQMCNHWSLYTDTSAYFLTVNPSGSNKRITNTVNNVAGNTLAPEPYFMYTIANYYKQQLNQGFGYNLGDIICSSSYETAEGWATSTLGYNQSFFDNETNLKMYNQQVNGANLTATLDMDIAGNSSNIRTYGIITNNSLPLIAGSISGYSIVRVHVPNIPLSSYSSGTAIIQMYNGAIPGDGVVVADCRLTYPRQFDFAGKTQLGFSLPASDTGNYLVISNFNYGATAPVLYDLTNNLRLTGILSSGTVQFALPPSATARNLILESADPTVLYSVNNFTQRNFVNYANAANQGDYLIISDSLLYDDGNGNNNVENYRQYRSSSAGGSYNAKTVDISQLIDQFAFGVKHHPLSIRNFSAYAMTNFATKPKFLFLIGKGLNYQQFRSYESNPAVIGQAMVPTFGWPGSDNLLTASRNGEYALLPLGRLSAINGKEIGNYLTKVKQFEQAQITAPQTINGKAWMKNIAQITGGLSDPGLSLLIDSYMQGYDATASDTLFGANVYQFSQNTGLNTAAGTNTTLGDLFSNGMSLLTYFGHASPNSLEFNLTSPDNYNNTGKYPAIMINGCDAGDLYEFDPLRPLTGGSLSEQFTFANQKGSIGFISSSSFGLPTELNYVNSGFYSNLCNYMYGQPLGNIMSTTMQNVWNVYFADYIAQTHIEQINLHGDPAIRLNPQALPDYAVEDSLLTFNPSVISVGSGSVTITARVINIGKAINQPLPVLIQRTLPDGSVQILFNGTIPALKYEDSIVLTLNINPLKDSGLNKITVTIDPNNTIQELSKTNNVVSKTFNIIQNQLLPIWPYNYSIVNNRSIHLFASTSNPLAPPAKYQMQIDTSALFNSPLMLSQTVTDSGGVIEFVPNLVFSDSTVYYWRVSAAPVIDSSTWLTSSFVYIDGTDSGFNQSHYYQFANNSYVGMNIDATTRRFGFNDETRSLLIRTGLYPYYNWDQINVNVDASIIDQYGCTYNSLQFYVYDSLTLATWQNTNTSSGTGQYGSAPLCSTPRSIFEFPYGNATYRANAIKFLDTIPNGEYVSISNLGYTATNSTFVKQWLADTTTLGKGNTLLDKFHQLGLNKIDSFTTNLPFLFVFRKGDSTSFPISQTIGPLQSTQIVNSYNIVGKQVQGTIQTPWLGSVKAWKHFKWLEAASDSSQDTHRRFDIIGQDTYGNLVTLASVYNATDTDISFINAAQYPNLKLLLYNSDSTHAEATQLNNWMLTGSPVPEGAIAPDLFLKTSDTLNLTDTLHFKVAFKNVSNVAFDSLKVRLTITDANGVAHTFTNLSSGAKLRPVIAGDTVIVSYDIPMLSYPGKNQLEIEINPDNDQPEQFHFNNVMYQVLYVLSPVCPGGSTSFTTGSSILGSTYQWQVNDGSGNGYVNVQPDAIYSGVNSSTLLVTSPPTNMYGYKYRCVITGTFSTTYSPESVLSFAESWTGNIDTAWEKTGNWNCGVIPDIYTDVSIKSGLTNYPVVNSNAACHSLSAAPATSVTIITGQSLNIAGPSGN